MDLLNVLRYIASFLSKCGFSDTHLHGVKPPRIQFNGCWSASSVLINRIFILCAMCGHLPE
jgi:hypothetical protein